MNDKLGRTAGLLCDIHRLAKSEIEIQKMLKKPDPEKSKIINPNSLPQIRQSAERHLNQDIELMLELIQRKYKQVSNLSTNNDFDIGYKWKQCDYILHALLLVLGQIDHIKILEKMSNENIIFFKDAISRVKKFERPDEEELVVAKKLEKEYHRRNGNSNLSPTVRTENNIIKFTAMITTLVAENWDVIVTEINKWEKSVKEHKIEAPIKQTKELSMPQPSTSISTTTPDKQQPIITEKTIPAVTKESKKSEPVPNDEKDKWWPVDKVAHYVGYDKITSFHMRKTNVKKEHPEILDWFTPNGRLFDSTHKDELKALFKMRLKKSEKTAVDKTTDKSVPVDDTQQNLGPVFEVGHGFVIPNTDAPVNNIEDSVQTILSDGGDRSVSGTSTVVSTDESKDNTILPDDHPTDLTGIKGLKTYIQTLNKLLDQAQKEETDLYEKLDAATKRVNELKETIKTAKGLLDEHTMFEQGLSEAQQGLQNTQEQIGKFLFEHQVER